jgi:hypothetical protein
LEAPKKKQRLCETYFECLTYATIGQRKCESTTSSSAGQEDEKPATQASVATHLIEAHYMPILRGFFSYKVSVQFGCGLVFVSVLSLMFCLFIIIFIVW